MRISDWSSDVCSSDLLPKCGSGGSREASAVLAGGDAGGALEGPREVALVIKAAGQSHLAERLIAIEQPLGGGDAAAGEIGMIGRAHVWTPATNAHIVSRLSPAQTKTHHDELYN